MQLFLVEAQGSLWRSATNVTMFSGLRSAGGRQQSRDVLW
jgi:hypothetical protein